MTAPALAVDPQLPTHDPAGYVMSAGDLGHWRAVEAWRRRTMPERMWAVVLRDGWGHLGAAVGVGLRWLPGVPGLDDVAGLLGGLGAVGTALGRASVGVSGVLDTYRRHGHEVGDLDEVRALEVAEVHAVRGDLTRSYVAVSAVHGGVSGLLAGLGAVASAGGGQHGPGLGGVAAMAAVVGVDVVLTAATCTRAVAHVAAYYGYDTGGDAEHSFALAVLSVSLAEATAKPAAYSELRAMSRGPAPARLGHTVAQRLTAQLSTREVAAAVPAVGIGLGAWLSGRLLSRVLDDADHLYRERFLREKYGLPADA